MSKKQFHELIEKELQRIDQAHTDKRNERIIEGFTKEACPKAIIDGKPYRVFNSNDYLGLRFDPEVKKAEHDAGEKFGTGPGAVRFISGTLKIHRQLEKALAKFHNREDAIVFSSAFAANVAVIASLIKGQSRDSLIDSNTLVVSDELNHRSIIEGIRVTNLAKEQRIVFPHFDYEILDNLLNENKGKYKRALVLTDGIFSMLGEAADLKAMKQVCDKYDPEYKEGIILFVDDSHGVGAFGKTGKGCEEVSNAKVDVVVGTLGKAFGADGGYAVSDKFTIDYLRESAATYIYSNSISPSVAGAGLASVNILMSQKGEKLLAKLEENVTAFKKMMKQAGFVFAADSSHPIQPILVADTEKTKKLTEQLFAAGILVTNINYPIVPKGKDEIRAQISAAHTEQDLDYFVSKSTAIGKNLGII